MTDALILHHYELSPYSEKVRRILAYKRLAWTAVRAPAVMPKPDLVTLTGGYRRIPVLQRGNHVYCDSALIARVLEQLAPEPTLYPSPLTAAIAEWGDVQLFEASLPWMMRPTRFDDMMRLFTPDELQRFAEDRRELSKDTTRAAVSGKTRRATFAVYLARLEQSLARTPFLLGETPCIADFAVYGPLWQLGRTGPEALVAYPLVSAFIARLSAIADPEIMPITSERAIAICKSSDPEWQPSAAFSDGIGLEPGRRVTVRASDYGRDPVAGTLAWAAPEEVVVRREDERAGVVYVHFPRVGYEITPADR
jgi:glutathione S-transferase